MRRLFVTIIIVYLLISFIGVISVNTRLKTTKEKAELLTEAHRSFIKRAEFKDIIFEIRRAVEEKRGMPEVSNLIRRSGEIIRECYGCHHSEHIISRIREAEKAVNDLITDAGRGDYRVLTLRTERIIPFVETAYERATFLTRSRLESATTELKRAERFTTITVISGAILFLAFSIITLYRISILQSRIQERERSLRNWAEQWQQTFDSIQDCLIITDKEGKIRLTNISTKQFFGKELINRSLVDVLDIPSIKKIEDLDNPSKEFVFSKEEKIFNLKTYHHNIDHNEKGYIIVIRDVTAEKEMEQRLIQAEKLSALSRTMATVATELHNPLTSVSKYSEVLLDLSSINKRIREIADKISVSTSRMSGIVGELLLFSKAPVLNKRPVEFRSMMEGVLKLIRESMNIEGINLAVDSEAKEVYIDRSKMERALLSLISNSINRIKRSRKGNYILIRGYEEKGLFHIDIIDNGPFIPRDMSHRIFEPFFADSDRKTGLDLSISYNIIRAHGGDVIVKSTEEETVFSIELPLY